MKKPDKNQQKLASNRYAPATIEPKWQSIWQKEGIYHPDLESANPTSHKASTFAKASADKSRGKPFYNLMMFPYPSAEGLHIGGVRTFSGVDVYGRFKRMQGHDVFEPFGLDGFGIHAENYALKIGANPADHAEVTEKNFYRQIKESAIGVDWDRTVETYKKDYYKWTQWLFAELFRAGLAYRKKSPVNFCPSCKTVLADEQVVQKTEDRRQKTDSGNQKTEVEIKIGVCERCETPVEKRDLEQWFFRITKYADRLLANIDSLNWTEKVKVAQRNWIGKKEGIEITYPVVLDSPPAGGSLEQYSSSEVEKIAVFTTRPDTNFGATFIALAPEHDLVQEILKQVQDDKKRDIEAYIEQVKTKTEIERQAEGKEKTGVFTGLYAINQLTGYKMPIWVSDFVLMGFGTGAVVGVPGHDKRDFEFAQKFGLEIIRVVVGRDGDKSEITKIEQVQEEEGTMINSDFLNGMDIHKATQKIMNFMIEKGYGKRKSTYHLRDWLISRQRYWGPPIPMIYCESCAKRGDSWFTASKTKKSSKEEDLVHSTNSLNGWIDNLEDNISEKGKNVNRQTRGVDLPGVEPGKFGLSIQPSEPAKPTPYSAYKKDDMSVNMDWNPAGWYPEENLPVELPYIKDFKPLGTGKAPLANHPEFYKTKCPNCGSDAVRETDVSDTFLDSSWYFFRYISTEFSDKPFDELRAKKWLPVHMYIGGAEHSVLHLLYARFITMFLKDKGLISFEEPFARFYAHGLIIKEGAKMSKSKGNVVGPDIYIKKFGSDTLRMYLHFLAPFNQDGDFRDEGIDGMNRFLKRLWALFTGSTISNMQPPTAAKMVMHQAIKKVTEEMEELRFNTAIAQLMTWYNYLAKQDIVTREETEVYLKLLAPFAPHMTEELYQTLKNADQNPTRSSHSPSGTIRTRLMERSGGAGAEKRGFESIHKSAWPQYDEKYLVSDMVKIPVQVNGKLRGMLEVPAADIGNKQRIEDLAKKDPKVAKFLDGHKVKQSIYIPGKVLNFVI